MLKHQIITLEDDTCGCRCQGEGDIISSKGARASKGHISSKRCEASSRVTSPHPKGDVSSSSSTKSSPSMQGRPKQASNHIKYDVIIKISNVLGQSVDVLHEEGSIIPRKGYAIIIKCNVIQSNPNMLRGCTVQPMTLLVLSMVHHALYATSNFIYPISKAQEVWGGASGHAKSSKNPTLYRSSVQCPLYNAKCLGHHHENVFQRTMSRVYHDQTRPTKSSKSSITRYNSH
jgi:hypothetical protein